MGYSSSELSMFCCVKVCLSGREGRLMRREAVLVDIEAVMMLLVPAATNGAVPLSFTRFSE